jgi:hypothetical protein
MANILPMLIEASYIRRCGLPRHHAFIHGGADGVHFARLPARSMIAQAARGVRRWAGNTIRHD